jgi:hypothetical protein
MSSRIDRNNETVEFKFSAIECIFHLLTIRYLLLVCTGNRLRAYVHHNGKNYYTPKPYKDPWENAFDNWDGIFRDRREFDLVGK